MITELSPPGVLWGKQYYAQETPMKPFFSPPAIAERAKTKEAGISLALSQGTLFEHTGPWGVAINSNRVGRVSLDS